MSIRCIGACVAEALEARQLLAAQAVQGLVPSGLGPTLFADLGKQTVFAGTTQATGRELFITDGTAAGTKLVANLTKGSAGSYFDEMMSVGPYVYFLATVNKQTALWRTDGTVAGTLLLHAFDDGGDTDPEKSTINLTNFNGNLYFKNGDDLWRSDGLVAGTKLVKSLTVKGDLGDPIQGIYVAGPDLYVTTHHDLVTRVWKSDGTKAGTVGVPFSTSLNIEFAGATNGHFFVVGQDYTGVKPNEIYVSDPVSGMKPLAIADSVSNFIDADGSGYFVEGFTGDRNTPPSERIMRFTSKKFSAVFTSTSTLDQLQPVGTDRIVFSQAGHQLWSIDLTTGAEPKLVEMLPTGAAPSQATIRGMTFNGKRDEFSVATPNGVQLWTTNGTRSKTTQVMSFSGDHTRPQGNGIGLTINDGVGYFSWINATGAGDLWRTDGTAAGTDIVTNPPTATGISANPQDLTPSGNDVFFLTRPTDASGYDSLQTFLWVTKKNGPATLLGVWSSAGPEGHANILGAINGELYLSLDAGITIGGAGIYDLGQIWKTDGTAQGTVYVCEAPQLTGITTWHHTIYANRPGQEELWRVTATTAVHVASGAGGYVGAGWEQPAVVDDKLFLRTTSSTLWEIDSSTAKAKVVQNLTISGQHGLVAGSGGYNSIAAYKGNLFALTDNQLNLIDVERNTITPIATLSSSTFDEGFSGPLCLFQNDLYFAADTDAGPALFRSDGTAKGTTLIKAVNSDPLNIPPRVLDGEMYFEITGGETQIWSTNGTGKGTVDMSDEDVQAIPVDFNGTLFFFANGQLFEFKKGSSKALTQYPGESSTAQPVVIGGVLYFIAGDNNSGGTALYDYVAS